MAMTNAEKVARSDEKRGMKAKTYKLPLATIALIEQLSIELKLPQYQVIQQAVVLLQQSKGA